MHISKLFSFIVVALLVAAVLAGLVSVPAAAPTNEATSTVTATTAVATAIHTVTTTTAPVTAATTIISIGFNPYPPNPNVGQTLTFYVYLRAGTTYLSKPVTIWHTEPDGIRVEDGTHTTDSSGLYTISQAFGTPGQRIYHAEFAGDSEYDASSASATVDVKPSGPNQAPIANAGPDQTVTINTKVTLDGTGSTDPDSNLPLTYAWVIQSTPAGSTIALSSTTEAKPSFTLDKTGDYVFALTVTDSLGLSSTTADTVKITATATPSVTPSVSPSASPTVTPSVSPSVSPSASPSVTPSASPSVTPSASPTVIPPTSPTPPVKPSPEFPLAMAGAGMMMLIVAGLYAVMRRRR